ncbi:related to SNF1-related protein kinase KIN10 [Moesziomyces antarcticus]|nr:related to SNF1-related protein kinase KIN10 [Moesziomyces antarcticus]
MFSRSRQNDAKRFSDPRSKLDGREPSTSGTIAIPPSPFQGVDTGVQNATAEPMLIHSRGVPTITTTSGTPIITPSWNDASTPRAELTQPGPLARVFVSSSPPVSPPAASVDRHEAGNSSFSVHSLDSFGAISMAGSTAAVDGGSQNGSRFGMSPTTASFVAPRGELSSASIRSRRNWDEFEGKPVSPLPSPAVQNQQTSDMFDVPIAASSSRLTPAAHSLASPQSRPTPARNQSLESMPSVGEAKGMSSPKSAAPADVGSKNWSFFNSTSSSGAPIARAPSIKATNSSSGADPPANPDSIEASTPLNLSSSRTSASATSLGHGMGPRVTSADLSSRIRLPSRLPTLPTEASASGIGGSTTRATSAHYYGPQQLAYLRHTRIGSGESIQSTDAPLYSPLYAVDPHAPGDLFNLNSTSQLSLSAISDAPSATLDGLPPHVPWAGDSPRRTRSRSHLLLDDDRSAQSSPASAVPPRPEQRPWREVGEAGDVSIDSTHAMMPTHAQLSSPAQSSRSELYSAPSSSALSASVAKDMRSTGLEEASKGLSQRTRRQGPSESATGSSILPAPVGRERPSQSAIVESREEEEDGDRIGPYRIEKTLGVGAFSRVALGRSIRSSSTASNASARFERMISSLPQLRQRAMQQQKTDTNGASAAAISDELVALKMLDREPCNNNERLKVSWVREVEVLKHISHPNLVRFIASFSTPLHHTLVLEHVAGGELFDALMSNFEQFSQREWLVRVLYTELANAVGWMHHINLVHRDIKLENILLTVNLFAAVSSAGGADASALPLRPHRLPDSEPLVKLTDFGLSRFIDPSNPLLETRCGSEEYAAPELIIGKKYDGRKTDAWALGVVLYALITGSLPFMEDVSVGANGAREGQGEERDPKQRKRHLLRIAKGDLRWPSPANDACEDQPDPAKCPASMRLVTPMAKAMVGRLLRRDATKRATPWETWDEPWLLCGSFGYASLSSPQNGQGALPSQQVPGEASAAGEAIALHPDPRSQQGQSWLEANAAVRQDDVAPVARDD